MFTVTIFFQITFQACPKHFRNICKKTKLNKYFRNPCNQSDIIGSYHKHVQTQTLQEFQTLKSRVFPHQRYTLQQADLALDLIMDSKEKPVNKPFMISNVESPNDKATFAQGHKYFWKPSLTCHVGIHWIALTEYSQMSTHVPGFQSFSGCFCIILYWQN